MHDNEKESKNPLNEKEDKLIFNSFVQDEDENKEAVERLALKLRDRPLLPPDPSDPQQNWPEASSGIKFATCHCAFKGCSWTSQRRPCDYRKPHHSHWHAHEGMWKEVSSRKQMSHTGFGCCEDPACLKSHITEHHLAELIDTCGAERVDFDSYDYYLEAIKHKESQKVPILGVSIDRRSFEQVRCDFSENAVQGLICMCCSTVRTSTNSRNSHIAYFSRCGDYF